MSKHHRLIHHSGIWLVVAMLLPSSLPAQENGFSGLAGIRGRSRQEAAKIDIGSSVPRAVLRAFGGDWNLTAEALWNDRWPAESAQVPLSDPSMPAELMAKLVEYRRVAVDQILRGLPRQLNVSTPQLTWDLPVPRPPMRDLEVHLFGAETERAVTLFNADFRARFSYEPVVALGCNVYAQGFLVGPPLTVKAPGSEQLVARQLCYPTVAKDVLRDEEDQEAWSLLRLRTHLTPDEWDSFWRAAAGLKPPPRATKTRSTVVEMATRYQRDLLAKMSALATAANPNVAVSLPPPSPTQSIHANLVAAASKLAPGAPVVADDLRIAAGNRLYEERLITVAALLRQLRQDQGQTPQQLGVASAEEKAARLSLQAVKLRQAISQANSFANGAYYTDGAVHQAVTGLAKGVAFRQSRAESFQAFNENLGLALYAVQANTGNLDAALEAAGTYLWRMANAAANMGLTDISDLREIAIFDKGGYDFFSPANHRKHRPGDLAPGFRELVPEVPNTDSLRVYLISTGITVAEKWYSLKEDERRQLGKPVSNSQPVSPVELAPPTPPIAAMFLVRPPDAGPSPAGAPDVAPSEKQATTPYFPIISLAKAQELSKIPLPHETFRRRFQKAIARQVLDNFGYEGFRAFTEDGDEEFYFYWWNSDSPKPGFNGNTYDYLIKSAVPGRADTLQFSDSYISRYGGVLKNVQYQDPTVQQLGKKLQEDSTAMVTSYEANFSEIDDQQRTINGKKVSKISYIMNQVIAREWAGKTDPNEPKLDWEKGISLQDLPQMPKPDGILFFQSVQAYVETYRQYVKLIESPNVLDQLRKNTAQAVEENGGMDVIERDGTRLIRWRLGLDPKATEIERQLRGQGDGPGKQIDVEVRLEKQDESTALKATFPSGGPVMVTDDFLHLVDENAVPHQLFELPASGRTASLSVRYAGVVNISVDPQSFQMFDSNKPSQGWYDLPLVQQALARKGGYSLSSATPDSQFQYGILKDLVISDAPTIVIKYPEGNLSEFKKAWVTSKKWNVEFLGVTIGRNGPDANYDDHAAVPIPGRSGGFSITFQHKTQFTDAVQFSWRTHAVGGTVQWIVPPQ